VNAAQLGFPPSAPNPGSRRATKGRCALREPLCAGSEAIGDPSGGAWGRGGAARLRPVRTANKSSEHLETPEILINRKKRGGKKKPTKRTPGAVLRSLPALSPTPPLSPPANGGRGQEVGGHLESLEGGRLFPFPSAQGTMRPHKAGAGAGPSAPFVPIQGLLRSRLWRPPPGPGPLTARELTCSGRAVRQQRVRENADNNKRVGRQPPPVCARTETPAERRAKGMEGSMGKQKLNAAEAPRG